jgi:DNA repair exonuclease SbcCD ATPase subunit
MEMRIIRLAAAVLFVAGWAASASAQSLADVARKEEARRKHVTKPARVLTNKDLKPSEIPIPPAGSEQAAPAGDAKPAEQKPADETEEQLARDEQTWRDRMAKARADLEHSEMYLDALQSKINALWADFTSRDDPAQRAAIETDRKKALAEFDRVKQEVQDRKKAIDDLEEEARKAGVPPGWLR